MPVLQVRGKIEEFSAGPELGPPNPPKSVGQTIHFFRQRSGDKSRIVNEIKWLRAAGRVYGPAYTPCGVFPHPFGTVFAILAIRLIPHKPLI
jgi:hypothetical protein